MKRLICAVLALALMMSLTTVTATADGEVKLPRFQYKANDVTAFLGKEVYVEMKVTYGGTLPADAVLELRDEEGNVWLTKNFKSSMQNMGIRFTPTEEQLGGHALNLWYGDQKITQEDLRFYISDRSKGPVKKVETDQPYMSISLDCGFDSKNTDIALKVLDEYGIKVTFFFTGYFVKNFPEDAAKIRDAGHEIGNHTMWHDRLCSVARTKQVAEIKNATKLIIEQLGVVPRLYRPPYGDIDSNITAIARSDGMEVAMWTIDSHDWDNAYTADKIFKRVTKDITPGTIILFHLDARYVEENLRRALDYYMGELGLGIVPITKLMEMGGMELPKSPHVTEEPAEAQPEEAPAADESAA